MAENIINEFDGSYGESGEYGNACVPCEPVNIAPPCEVPKNVPALLAPTPDPSVTCVSNNISIFPDGVTITDGNGDNDCVTMDLTFTVMCDGINGKVVKKIQVSKSRLLSDLKLQNLSTPVTMVEQKKTEKNEKPAAQRMRELAGIPHKNNYT